MSAKQAAATTAQAPDLKHAMQKVIINVTLGADGEPKRQFVGWDGRDYEIERGKDIQVPRGLLEVLDNAIIGVPEAYDESDPSKIRMVDRKRFPYTMIGVVTQ